MQQRRLAAIMFTDIVGYTTLMGKDEQKAFEILKKNRRIHWRLIKKYKGKWLKEMGDGILASFPSNIDAILCATSIQIAARDLEIPLRIGIHQGDVIFENKDVLGDGVNIASRIQGTAEQSGIVISVTVYKEIRNKEGIRTEFIGEKSLKGVDGSIGIYKVSCEDASVLAFEIDTGELIKPLGTRKSQLLIGVIIAAVLVIISWVYLPKILKSSVTLDKSIAVLPFEYLSEDASKAYLSDGVMDAITSHLSKIGGLRVIPRTTVEQYRETQKTASEIGEELNVSFLLEGSFLFHREAARLTLDLINPKEENQIWSEEYDLEWEKLFDVQSEITQDIAGQLQVVISPQEKRLISTNPTVNEEAYDLFLKGRELAIKAERNNDFSQIDTTIYYFKSAIELDPQFALAFVHLGMQYFQKRFYDDYLKDTFADTLLYFANKALSIDPYLAEGYWLRGKYFQEKGQNENSIIEFEKAISLNPNDGESYLSLARQYNYTGKIVLAIKNAAKAKKLLIENYRYRNVLTVLGIAFNYLGDNERAYAVFEELKLYDTYAAYSYLPYFAWSNQEWEKCKQYIDEYCAIDSMNCIRFLSEYYRRTKNFEEAYKYELKRRKIWETHPDPRFLDNHKYAYILYNMGREEEAKEYFERHINYCKEVIRLGRPWHATRTKVHLAMVYSFIGELEKAIDLIHEVENELPPIWCTRLPRAEPISENLWYDEEFQKIAKRQEKRMTEMQAEVEKMDEEGLL